MSVSFFDTNFQGGFLGSPVDSKENFIPKEGQDFDGARFSPLHQVCPYRKLALFENKDFFVT